MSGGRRRKLAITTGRSSSNKKESPNATSSRNKRARPNEEAPHVVAASRTKAPPPPPRPDPPPPPPKSLVRLLKADPSVVEYFTSLQENLAWDVQKWKGRARDYQGQLETVQAKLDAALEQNARESLPNQNEESDESGYRHTANAVAKEVEYHQKSTSNQTKDQNSTTLNGQEVAKGKNDQANGGVDGGVPIDDAMFDAMFEEELSSDDDSDKDETTDQKVKAQSLLPTTPDTIRHTTTRGVAERDHNLFQFSSDNSSSTGDEGKTSTNHNNDNLNLTPTNPKTSPPMNDSDSFKDDMEIQHSYGNNKNTKDSSLSLEDQREGYAIRQLLEAERCFHRLGILLVDRKDVSPKSVDIPKSSPSERLHKEGLTESLDETCESNGKHNANLVEEEGKDENSTQRAAKGETIFSRRSNELVVTDLVHVLKSLIRIKHTIGDQVVYHPFASSQLVPCYRSSEGGDEDDESVLQHPAREGKQCALSALAILDAFGHVLPAGTDGETIIFPNDGDDDESSSSCRQRQQRDLALFAMKGRRELVEGVVASLHGEIVQAWPIQDRSSRRLTTSLHFQEESEALARQQRDDAEHQTDTQKQTKSFQGLPSLASKNHLRLATIVERCLLAELVTSIYLIRNDPQRAAHLVWTYVVATAPSLHLTTEDYKSLPPVLSLCVLEAMLCPEDSTWLSKHYRANQHLGLLDDGNDKDDSRSDRKSGHQPARSWFSSTLLQKSEGTASKVLAMTIHATARIHDRRVQSLDNRISDVSRVELAAFKRLLSLESSWLLRGVDLNCATLHDAQITANRTITDIVSKTFENSSFRGESQGICASIAPLHLAMIVNGNRAEIDKIFEEAFGAWKATTQGNTGTTTTTNKYRCIILVCAMSKRQLEIRQIDEYRHRVSNRLIWSNSSESPFSATTQISNVLVDSSTQSHGQLLTNFETALLCCRELADGESAIRLIQWLVRRSWKIAHGETNDTADVSRLLLRSILSTLQTVGDVPTIRVINLQRRKDRWKAFCAQALHERLMIVKGVTRPDIDIDNQDGGDSFCKIDGHWHGQYAFDGQGRMAEAEQRLVQQVCGGNLLQLNGLVEPHWRPNDLKLFDTAAPESENLVRISPSEKACALSHIATWKGVVQCLSDIQKMDRQGTLKSDHQRRDESDPDCGMLLRHAGHTLCQFQISGYARGTAMLHQCEGASAAPVCVILEDDAILVDRFTDRLNLLLEELPRDFHFCSLGYSRPKTAPLIPYSSQLGIPTSIWYLTGYVLSLEGAKYLLNQLPVRGPVDSWIGLLMFGNWDNIYGQAAGLGVHFVKPGTAGSNSGEGSSSTLLPPRKDLTRILRFRAFAALVPLCTQKVGVGGGTGGPGGGGVDSAAGTGQRNWRQRDSDIVYSGSDLE